MPQTPVAADTPQNILIRIPNPIGDVVMATASVTDVRRTFPHAHITLLARPAQARILLGADYYNELIEDDSARGLRCLLGLARRLRRRRFDLCLLYNNSLRTAALVALAGIPARVGYAKGGQHLFLTQAVQPIFETRKKWLPMPMPSIYARLCAAAGVVPGDGRPRLAVTAECEERARRLRRELGIGDTELLIGLVPGAAFGQSKLWPPAHFAALADRLTGRYGLRTILLSGPGEEAIARELVGHMSTRPITTARPLDLDTLKPFIRDLKLLVATDSGPRHYGTAFQVPTVVVMGPTDPRWSGANLELQEVVRHDVPCGPCHLQVCPIDHRCMVGITAEEVLERVARLDRRLGIFAPVGSANTAHASAPRAGMPR